MVRKQSAVLSLFCALFATSACAGPITWRLEGVVNFVQNAGGQLPLPASIGDLFAVEYTFESLTADDPATAGNTRVGLYRGAVSAATFFVGGNRFEFPSIRGPMDNFIVVEDAFLDRDRYALHFQSNAQPPALTYAVNLDIGWDALFPGAIVTDTLLVVPPSMEALNAATNSGFNFVAVQGITTDVISGRVLGISAVQVPEPAIGWLMLAGLIAVAGLRRNSATSLRLQPAGDAVRMRAPISQLRRCTVRKYKDLLEAGCFRGHPQAS
jgi:hypothetical protein